MKEREREREMGKDESERDTLEGEGVTLREMRVKGIEKEK